jgi:hypothetical protein
MNDLAGCRYMERLCRQRAVFDHPYIGNNWVTRNDGKTSLTLQSGIAFGRSRSIQVPWQWGRTPLKGDSHRQKHESMQRLQSVTRAVERSLAR